MNRHLIKNLLVILDNELNVLTNLLALEKEKNNVLVGRNLNELERVVDAENVLSETLSCLEEERIHFMEKNHYQPNLSDFIIETPEENRHDLIERQQVLVDSLRMLKIYNEMNNKILSESIKFFKYSINLFTGSGDSGRTYGLNGMENTMTGPGPALVLDHKI
jgi:flagellar biosynthesis/type III secretory pathway chaperone